jgi:hypothetical protein
MLDECCEKEGASEEDDAEKLKFGLSGGGVQYVEPPSEKKKK